MNDKDNVLNKTQSESSVEIQEDEETASVSRVDLNDLITNEGYSLNSIQTGFNINKKSFVDSFGPLFGNNVVYSDILSDSALKDAKFYFCHKSVIDEIQYKIVEMQEKDPGLADKYKKILKASKFKWYLIDREKSIKKILSLDELSLAEHNFNFVPKINDDFALDDDWVVSASGVLREGKIYKKGGLVNPYPNSKNNPNGWLKVLPSFLYGKYSFGFPVTIKTDISFNIDGSVNNYYILIRRDFTEGAKVKSFEELVDEVKLPIMKSLVLKLLTATYVFGTWGYIDDRNGLNDGVAKAGIIAAYPSIDNIVKSKTKEKFALKEGFSDVVVKEETFQTIQKHWREYFNYEVTVGTIVDRNFPSSRWEAFSNGELINNVTKEGTDHYRSASYPILKFDKQDVDDWNEYYTITNFVRMVLSRWIITYRKLAKETERKDEVTIDRNKFVRDLLSDQAVIYTTPVEYDDAYGEVAVEERDVYFKAVLASEVNGFSHSASNVEWLFAIPAPFAAGTNTSVSGEVSSFLTKYTDNGVLRNRIILNDSALNHLLDAIEAFNVIFYKSEEKPVNAKKFINYVNNSFIDGILKKSTFQFSIDAYLLALAGDSSTEEQMKKDFSLELQEVRRPFNYPGSGMNLPKIVTLKGARERQKVLSMLINESSDPCCLFISDKKRQNNSGIFMLSGFYYLAKSSNMIEPNNWNSFSDDLKYKKFGEYLNNREDNFLFYAPFMNLQRTIFLSEYFNELSKAAKSEKWGKSLINPDLVRTLTPSNKLFAVFNSKLKEKDEYENFNVRDIAEDASMFDELSDPDNLLDFVVGHGREGFFQIQDQDNINAFVKLSNFEPMSPDQLNYIMSEDFEKDWTRKVYYRFDVDRKARFRVKKSEVNFDSNGKPISPFEEQEEPIIDIERLRTNISIPVDALDTFAISSYAKTMAGVTREIRTIGASYQSILDINKGDAAKKTSQIGELLNMFENINSSLSDLEDSFIQSSSESPSQRRISTKGSSLITKFDTSLKDPFLILLNWKERARQKIRKMRYLNSNSNKAKDFEKVISSILIPTFDWSKIREIFSNLFSKAVAITGDILDRALSVFAIFDNLMNIVETMRYPFKVLDIKFGKVLDSKQGDKFLAVFPIPKDLVVDQSMLTRGSRKFLNNLTVQGGSSKEVKIAKVYIPELKAYFNSIVFLVDEYNKDGLEALSDSIVHDSSLSELSKFISMVNGIRMVVDPELNSHEKEVIAGVIVAQALASAGSAAIIAQGWQNRAISFVLSALTTASVNINASRKYYAKTNAVISDFLSPVPENLDYLTGFIEGEEVLISSLNNLSAMPLTPAYLIGSVMAQATAILGGFATAIMIGAFIGGVVNTVIRNYKLIHRAVLLRGNQKKLKNEMAKEFAEAKIASESELKNRKDYADLDEFEQQKISDNLIKQKNNEIKLKYSKMEGGLAFMNTSQILGMARFQNFLKKSGFTPFALKTFKNTTKALIGAVGSAALIGGKTVAKVIDKIIPDKIGKDGRDRLLEKIAKGKEKEFDDTRILAAIDSINGIY